MVRMSTRKDCMTKTQRPSIELARLGVTVPFFEKTRRITTYEVYVPQWQSCVYVLWYHQRDEQFWQIGMQNTPHGNEMHALGRPGETLDAVQVRFIDMLLQTRKHADTVLNSILAHGLAAGLTSQ